jgi:hypothetical protein
MFSSCFIFTKDITFVISILAFNYISQFEMKGNGRVVVVVAVFANFNPN